MDALIAKFTSGVTNWYLTDLVGSVRDIAGPTGSLLDHRDWDAFGNLKYESSPSNTDRYGYTGRELQTETNLQYNRARWYDPVTKRWLSQDPLGFDAGDSNLYRYVSNQPVGATDPTGQDIYFLLASDGFFGAGHAAMIIGPINFVVKDPATGKETREQKYAYLAVDFEKSKVFKPKIAGYAFWGSGFQFTEEWFDSPKAALDAHTRFNNILMFKTTPVQDVNAYIGVRSKWSSEEGYRLLFSNCSDAALDALKAA
jgi:RHS repeat-associated protein